MLPVFHPTGFSSEGTILTYREELLIPILPTVKGVSEHIKKERPGMRQGVLRFRERKSGT